MAMPPRSSTVLDVPRRRASDSAKTMASDAERAREARQRHHGDAQQREIGVRREREHRAERRAGRHAERVRRRERISQQRLKHDARQRQPGADDRGGDHAGQARDEKDLRVDVVGKRQPAIEDPRQRLIDVLPDQRREEADQQRRARRSPASVTAIRRRMSLRPGKRHHREMAGAWMKRARRRPRHTAGGCWRRSGPRASFPARARGRL